MIKRQGEQLIPDFTEEDLICGFGTVVDKAMYPSSFVEISRISQQDEKEIGYDGVLTSIVPFYLQFKRSSFFTPSFRGKLMCDRRNFKLSTKRGFFGFSLHLNKNGESEQHNVLFELSKRYKAAYIAPMFLKKTQLTEYKMQALKYAWIYDDVFIFDSEIDDLYLYRVKFFDKLVTIPPHKLISDRFVTHQYSFSSDNEICFHSEPELIKAEGKVTFNAFLHSILSNENLEVNLAEHANNMISLLPKFLTLEFESEPFRFVLTDSAIYNGIFSDKILKMERVADIIKQLTPYMKLAIVEDILKRYFGIIQYFKFLRNV